MGAELNPRVAAAEDSSAAAAISTARSRSASESQSAAGNRRCVLKTQLRGVPSASLTACESFASMVSHASAMGRRPKAIGTGIGDAKPPEPRKVTFDSNVHVPLPALGPFSRI